MKGYIKIDYLDNGQCTLSHEGLSDSEILMMLEHTREILLEKMCLKDKAEIVEGRRYLCKVKRGGVEELKRGIMEVTEENYQNKNMDRLTAINRGNRREFHEIYKIVEDLGPIGEFEKKTKIK